MYGGWCTYLGVLGGVYTVVLCPPYIPGVLGSRSLLCATFSPLLMGLGKLFLPHSLLLPRLPEANCATFRPFSLGSLRLIVPHSLLLGVLWVSSGCPFGVPLLVSFWCNYWCPFWCHYGCPFWCHYGCPFGVLLGVLFGVLLGVPFSVFSLPF